MPKQLRSSLFMKEDFPFWIHRVVHDSKHTPASHSHDFVELVYVVRGEAKHCFEGEQYDIRAGDVFFINPGEEHTYAFAPGQQIEIINCLFLPSLIGDSLLRELGVSQSMDYFYVHPFLQKSERFVHRLNLHGPEAETILTILESMMREVNERKAGFDTIIRLKMIELQLLLSRYYSLRQMTAPSSRREENRIMARRIRGYLERNFDQKITVPQLAAVFNISARQLNRLIRQETGMSTIDLLHSIRIDRAKHLLAESNEKVIAVASMVGYDDPSFFSRLFMRKVGCSPGNYRYGGAAKRAASCPVSEAAYEHNVEHNVDE
jgi:AraC-like DNA-binding protein